MKRLNETRICKKIGIFLIAAMLLAVNVFAAEDMFESVYAPVVNLLNSLLGPLLAVVSAVGALYCVLLGVKYAKAEEPQDREKAKSHLKNAIIGFVLIFVLILALNQLLPVMKKWVNSEVVARNGSVVFTDVAAPKPTATPKP